MLELDGTTTSDVKLSTFQEIRVAIPLRRYDYYKIRFNNYSLNYARCEIQKFESALIKIAFIELWINIIYILT